MIVFIELFLYTRHFAKSFSFNSHNNPVSLVLSLFLFYNWGNSGMEGSSNLSNSEFTSGFSVLSWSTCRSLHLQNRDTNSYFI